MNSLFNPKPYEWMVRYTPQQEWIVGRNALLWLAFFLTELGAGIYFVSLFWNLKLGMLAGWLISLPLGGVIHLLYLGNPARSWRMLLRPGASELSRGLWFTIVYAGVGLFQVAPVVFPGLPWGGDSTVLSVIMGLLCLMVMSHGFLTMGVIRAISAWSSTVLIPLSLISGIWMGSQGVELLLAILGRDMAMAELWSRWSLLCFALMTVIYLMGTHHASESGKLSVHNMVRGEWSKYFIGLVVLVGLVIPAVITVYIGVRGVAQANIAILSIRCACVVIGDMSLRYGIMRNGFYRPLI